MATRSVWRDLFKGRHLEREIIILWVRWYLSYKLSSRDLVEMMSERGVLLAQTTILRWVQRYMPFFEKRWGSSARPVGGSWRCDETYIKVRGRSRTPLPGRRQGGPDRGFLPQREAPCRRRETVLPQGNEEAGRAAGDHFGRTGGLAPGRV
jgi:hypothetical protein